MNLDEAITQFKEDAENNRIDLDFSFAEENEQIADWLTQLKEYKQLEADGKLLKLPCKPGEVVFEIVGRTTNGYDCKYFTPETAHIRQTSFSLEKLYDIDRTIFLTMDAAEKRLSELKGKEEEFDYER